MAETQNQEPAAEGEKATAKANVKVAKKTSKKVAKKAAKKTSKGKGKGKTGTRYSEEVKAEAVAYINDNPGRGIVGKAMKKYGVSYISIRNWLKNAGVKGKKAAKGTGTPKVKGKRGRPPGTATASSKTFGSGDTLDTLMAAIKAKKAELSDLLKKFEMEARTL
jgi:transposase-like protein